jgi:hypothetical protein
VTDPLAAAPQPERGSGLSRRFRITIMAVVLIVIVAVGIIGYAVTGLAYAQTRVGNADKTLNSVISHQNNLNNTFADLNTKFNGLSSATTDPLQARQLFDQFVANEKAAGVTDLQDQASLVSTKATLTERSWLTLIAQSSLDKEAARIDHAVKAVSTAKTTTDGYVQDGQFFQSYFDAQIDAEMFNTQVASADLSAAKTTLTTMKGHVDTGLKLSSAPGLPADLHSAMVDLGTLVTDFGKLLDAAGASDYTAITNAENAVQADANKVGTYDLNKILANINAYYAPMFDEINAEMAKAAG